MHLGFLAPEAPYNSPPRPLLRAEQPHLLDEEDGNAEAGTEAGHNAEGDGDVLGVELERNLRQLLSLRT